MKWLDIGGQNCTPNNTQRRVRRKWVADQVVRGCRKKFDLASYARANGKLAALSDEERVALVALGWFARERIADWPRTYERAIKMTPTLDEVYQIGLGSYWLPGLDRWESKPAPFSAGQWHRADRP